MTRMSRLATLITIAVLAISIPSLAAEKPVTVAGWVSDTACGVQHVNGANPGCVRKCMRGGAAIGHPEWKPQAMVLVDDADRSLWTVRNPNFLLGHEGEHVSITARRDPRHKTLQVLAVETSAK
jgi:hypothetical protein